MQGKYTIMGFFWRVDPENNSLGTTEYGLQNFVGDVFIKEDGHFQGELVDSYGESKISGIIEGHRMDFIKIYTKPTKSAVNVPIQFVFGNEAGNGWRGIYEFFTKSDGSDEVETVKGDAACMIFPAMATKVLAILKKDPSILAKDPS